MNAISGPPPWTCFAEFDRDSRSWRTCLILFPRDTWPEFSGTWPYSGSMQNGQCSPRQRSERRTRGNGCGSWPTPDASVSTRYNQSGSPGAAIRPCLAAAVKWPTPMEADSHRGSSKFPRGNQTLLGAIEWPTPTVNDSRGGRSKTATRRKRSPNVHGGETLTDALRATPAARDWRSGKASQETMEGNARPLNEQVGAARLNPDWVEQLSFWPRGWSRLPESSLAEIKRSTTGKRRARPKSEVSESPA